MHHLSIDLETYSSVPIAKAGAQKYISSPDFEILLFAYSVDGAPVEIIDLARGERLPPWLVQAITSPEYIKHAYNAPFEWGCLSKFLGTLPPDQWRCTMFHGLYCGYTAGLDATGKALDEDGQPVMKPWYEVTAEDQKAIMEATTWNEADFGYFRGGGYSSRYIYTNIAGGPGRQLCEPGIYGKRTAARML